MSATLQSYSDLSDLKHSGNISQPLHRQLQPSNSKCPRLFRQPKIHEKDVPLHPIIASTGGPNYDTARHLTKILKPLVGSTVHHIKNSDRFATLIQDLTLQPDDIMVSLKQHFSPHPTHPSQTWNSSIPYSS